MKIETKELVGGVRLTAVAERNGETAECVRLEIVSAAGRRAECWVSLAVDYCGRAKVGLRAVTRRGACRDALHTHGLPWISEPNGHKGENS